MVELTIDGRTVEAEPGTTIMQAASSQGIKIPSLCYHKALIPWGSCRLCVVEVAGRSKLAASCGAPVEEGIEVRTDSPRVVEARKLVSELLLLRCPDVPRIQELAGEMGADETRLKRFEPDDEDCILCGLCVRICKERMGINAVDFINRGPDRKVSPPYSRHSPICQTCGACESVCPTGAVHLADVTENTPRPIPSEFNLGLVARKPIYIPFPQAVPKVPVIDPDTCVFFQRGACRTCVDFCEVKALDFEQTDRVEEVEVGSVIVATGFDTFDARRISRYGYGTLPNVITSLEFERLANASGPTGGKIVLKDGRTPERVGIIHCVGSRDVNYNVYCSRVCCMASLKVAHLVKEKTHGEVYNFYIDVRAAGKGYEEFYLRVMGEGAHLIRGRVGEVTASPQVPEEEGHLIVQVEDTLIGVIRRIPLDMVVLAVAMEPRTDAEEVARLFKISRSSDGFFLEKHPKLDPVATTTDGVLVVGACQGPKDIPDTVAQASAAAARALAMISKGVVVPEAATAVVDPTLCQGCGRCEEICEFGAPKVRLNGAMVPVSSINEAMCKGCGACAVACPTGAISIKHFTREEILAEIEALAGVPV